MGLLILTSFDTPQGFSVSSVYCRIGRFTYDPRGGNQFIITMKNECYLNRAYRLSGKSPVVPPSVPELISVEGTFGDMTYLYSLLKTNLEASGLVVEDVLETSDQPL